MIVRRTGSQQRPRRHAASARTRLLLTIFCLLPLLSTLTIRAQQQISLGNATAELTGPWKFHTGDNPAWADPSFNDSAWGTMDLTPPPGYFDPVRGTSGYVPGWTARGYPGYFGYAWYRLRVNVRQPAHSGNAGLALKMPDRFDDAYQVYVNGQLIGQFGRFTPHGANVYMFSQPRAFLLATNIRSGPITIAIRMWMEPDTLLSPERGGLRKPPVLGQASVVSDLLRLNWYVIDRSTDSSFLEMAVLLLALLVAFGLFRLDRTEPAYLWLGLTCAIILLYHGMGLVALYTSRNSLTLGGWLVYLALVPVANGLWVIFWGYWFRVGHMAWLHRAVWGLVMLLAAAWDIPASPIYGRMVSVHAIVWLSSLNVLFKLLLGVLLVWVAVRGIRKNKTEGWLALPAVLLETATRYQQEMTVLHIHTVVFPFGFSISFGEIATMLSLAIITVLMLRRFLNAQRQREQLKLEIEQARQLQQVLIPEQLPPIPGYALQTEYRPAQQVGGDFFQIIVSPNNTILLVVGDVSGKGLEAAMLVSLIVGAIRMVAETTQDPITVLQALNRRLCGRLRGHFATCVVARVHPSGETTIANAGHLSPYLNGLEVAIAGSLPLGLAADAEFEQTTLILNLGDRLTLITDGVVEAQDQHKNLFGFERTTKLLQQNNSASQVADAIQTFGQEDDITVVSVTRTPTPQPAKAPIHNSPQLHPAISPA